VFGHLFERRHHAMLSTEKVTRVLGVENRYDLAGGHAQTYEWFLRQGFDRLERPLADPVWKASWDFDAESTVADRIRRG
jgi:hypothetical protein